ncbi:MAG: ABC transporter substrate-binding protein [Eubacteriales bacterium]|nr:ABC transporter substrate-binding protein [Eubacteriales bacterium]
MKKKLAFLMSAAMLMGMMGTTAQASEEAQDFSGITLTLAYNTSGDVADAFLEQFAAFEALTGCTVEVEKLASDASESDSMMQIRAATGELPDIWLNSVGANLKSMSPQENCYDLSGQEWIGRIADTYREIGTDDETGAVYVVPATTSNVAGVFYNKTEYEALGLEIPVTWDEFLENCEIIRQNTDKDPCASPYDSASGVQILFLAQYFYVQQENPDFAEQYTNREVELHESEAYMRGLTKMYDLWEKGYQTEDPLSLSFEDAALQLANGEAVMLICRTNVMGTVEMLAPEKLDEIGFFPLPDEDGDALGVATWMPTGWVMNQNIAAEKEACALAFLEYLTTSDAIDVYCTKTTPTGAFMLKDIELPDTVSNAVVEAQEWVSKASSPVMEYFSDIKGANIATILQMAGTGEYTPEEAIAEIEQDNAIDAQQKGIEGW